MSNVPFAEVIFLHELFQDYHLHGFPSIQSKYIRMSGLISAINYSEKYLIFEDIRNRLKLYVEISLIDYSLLKIGDLFQVIGTINRGFPPHSLDLEKYDGCDDVFHLKAKIVRNVTGLDLNLYEKALLKRREYLQAMQT